MKNFATKKERTKAIKLFRMAQDRLRNGHSMYVCVSLSSAAEDTEKGQDFSQRIVSRLHREINRRIAPWGTVTGWLQDPARFNGELVYTDEQARDYRIRWIDSMIQELEALG